MILIAAGLLLAVVIALGIYSVARPSTGDSSINSSRAPFNLFLDDTVAEEYPEVVEALQLAIDFFNESTGLQLFQPLDEFGSGDVIPVIAYDPKEHDRGFCHEESFAFIAFDDDGTHFICVDVDRFQSYDVVGEAEYAFAHELGHIVGLSHDGFTSSIMFTNNIPLDPEILLKDLEFLREAYKGDDGSDELQ